MRTTRPISLMAALFAALFLTFSAQAEEEIVDTIETDIAVEVDRPPVDAPPPADEDSAEDGE